MKTICNLLLLCLFCFALFLSSGCQNKPAAVAENVEEIIIGTEEAMSVPFIDLVGSDWGLSVAFSPDGTKIVAGDSQNNVRIWDVESGQELRQWKGQINKAPPIVTSSGERDTGTVNYVAFSPDGEKISNRSRIFSILRPDLAVLVRDTGRRSPPAKKT